MKHPVTKILILLACYNVPLAIKWVKDMTTDTSKEVYQATTSAGNISPNVAAALKKYEQVIDLDVGGYD